MAKTGLTVHANNSADASICRHMICRNLIHAEQIKSTVRIDSLSMTSSQTVAPDPVSEIPGFQRELRLPERHDPQGRLDFGGRRLSPKLSETEREDGTLIRR